MRNNEQPNKPFTPHCRDNNSNFNININTDKMKAIVKNQTSKILFWQKLNRIPYSQYLRFKRMFEAKNNGLMIRGCTTNELGITTFILDK